ncbi:MAG: isochorismate synthase [Candidatus Kariarchaeaceae archaeon]|jgi:menaquinone-specific isochorismate synthase
MDNVLSNIKQQLIQGQQHDVLVSVSVRVRKKSFVQFFENSKEKNKVFFSDNTSTLKFAGVGVTKVIKSDDENRFIHVEEEIEKFYEDAVICIENNNQVVGPKFFGGFSFFNERQQDLWSKFGNSYFVLPELQLTQAQDYYWLTINTIHNKDTSVEKTLQYLNTAIHLELEDKHRKASENYTSVQNIENPIDFTEWKHSIERIQSKINDGLISKTVLARACIVTTEESIQPRTKIFDLHKNYPSCYTFLIEPIADHAFYGATPEVLAEVKGDYFQTVALAGSIGRSSDKSEDELLGKELMNSTKNLNEHKFVVDQISQNLRDITDSLTIHEKPELFKLRNIQHLKTSIDGYLANNQSLFSLIKQMHPTPAVGGTPKEKALEEIKAIEQTPRGWYASPIGWVDHRKNGCFVVGIRSVISRENIAILYAGAGIVQKSDPFEEWKETELKFQPILEIL